MNDTVRLRKLALTALFVAVGILLAPFSIPLGAAKTFPFQHMLNVLIAVFSDSPFKFLSFLIFSACLSLNLNQYVLRWEWGPYWLIPEA